MFAVGRWICYRAMPSAVRVIIKPSTLDGNRDSQAFKDPSEKFSCFILKASARV